MKELSTEEKAKAYDETINKAKSKIKNDKDHVLYENDIIEIFPELKESEDERTWIINYLRNKELNSSIIAEKENLKKAIAWLEKQSKETSWKPSKDEMDALYGLAYITNKMDDKKDEAITKLYQDLKREIFNGSSYENMFPSNLVDALNSLPKDNWELIREFITKFGRMPKDEDELNVLVQYVLKRQKPAWSEEDKRILSNINLYIRKAREFPHFGKENIEEADNWLKSLKDRVLLQSEKEWSEEDKKLWVHDDDIFLDAAKMIVEDSPRKSYGGVHKKEIVPWFYSLKERLKSLRPQNTLKPSDEQMTQLKRYCPDNRPLTSLYEQLKKLREE